MGPLLVSTTSNKPLPDLCSAKARSRTRVLAARQYSTDTPYRCS
jgi:hypothetical protein